MINALRNYIGYNPNAGRLPTITDGILAGQQVNQGRLNLLNSSFDTYFNRNSVFDDGNFRLNYANQINNGATREQALNFIGNSPNPFLANSAVNLNLSQQTAQNNVHQQQNNQVLQAQLDALYQALQGGQQGPAQSSNPYQRNLPNIYNPAPSTRDPIRRYSGVKPHDQISYTDSLQFLPEIF